MSKNNLLDDSFSAQTLLLNEQTLLLNDDFLHTIFAQWANNFARWQSFGRIFLLNEQQFSLNGLCSTFLLLTFVCSNVLLKFDYSRGSTSTTPLTRSTHVWKNEANSESPKRWWRTRQGLYLRPRACVNLLPLRDIGQYKADLQLIKRTPWTSVKSEPRKATPHVDA